MNNVSRRRFLQIGARAIASSGLALGASPLKTLAQSADGLAGEFDNYRALVCVYLDGGCDGFSLWVPNGSYENAEFAQSRGNLAIYTDQLLALSGGSSSLGLHPSAQPLQPLFDEGKLAVLANVGTLIEPTTREQFDNKTVALPAQLFSHSDQTIQWQQLQGRDREQNGWGARAADLLSEFQEREYLTSISLSGSNYWQSGLHQSPFSITESGVPVYQGMRPQSTWEQPRTEAFEQVLNAPHKHVLARAYADLQKKALTATHELGQVVDANSELFSDLPQGNELAAKLSMVAQLIAANETLGLKRQIFYVSMGGFDVHDQQSQNLPRLFDELASALSYFQSKLDVLGQTNNVTTFTASDFGRALNSNGDGTDHGWGNHLFALGGAVQGGQIYGELPSLDIAGPDSVNRGRIIPTTSASQYASTLLQWFGLHPREIDVILPLINNFSSRDLGFLA
ncbi:MAG: DUF1501 domain-containing protein [Granulosicoccus sp.]